MGGSSEGTAIEGLLLRDCCPAQEIEPCCGFYARDVEKRRGGTDS